MAMAGPPQRQAAPAAAGWLQLRRAPSPRLPSAGLAREQSASAARCCRYFKLPPRPALAVLPKQMRVPEASRSRVCCASLEQLSSKPPRRTRWGLRPRARAASACVRGAGAGGQTALVLSTPLHLPALPNASLAAPPPPVEQALESRQVGLGWAGRGPESWGGVGLGGTGLNSGLQGSGGQRWTLRGSASRMVAAEVPQLRLERPPRTAPEINAACVCHGAGHSVGQGCCVRAGVGGRPPTQDAGAA